MTPPIDDKHASGPYLDPDAEFKRDVIANLARLAQAIENTNERMLEVASEVRRQPCGEHLKWLQTMDERGTKANSDVQARLTEVEHKMEAISLSSKARPPSGESRPKTGGGHAAVREEDMARAIEDYSERVVIPRAEQAAEERVAELEAQRDRMAKLLEGERVRAREEAEDAATKLEAVRAKAQSDAAKSAAEMEAQRVAAELRRRAFIHNLVIGAITAALAGGGVAAIRCEQSAKATVQRAAPVRVLDASVFHNGQGR